jgi:GAF domain-containing protein
MNDTTNATDDGEPMRALAELALITVNTDPADQVLRRVAELAKRALVDVADVSLTIIHDREPHSMVFTGPLAVELDERQYGLGFGPCLDAAKTGQTIVVDTNAHDSHYAEFARIAARAGVRSVISIGLPLNQRCIGGLNIYRTTHTALDPAFLQQAEAFASFAAVAVNNVTRYAEMAADAADLRTAMRSRAVIEQAKGIIMARDYCTAEEAFDILRRTSQHKNLKLRDLAQDLVNAVKQ